MNLLFHLAIPIKDITQAKSFYVEGLGCEVGRETAKAAILNFYGHQVTIHETPDELPRQNGIYPRHFGLIFPEEKDWENLVTKAKEKQLNFYQEPKTRFLGQLTEHRTFFLEDPFHNLLEFKFYRNYEAIFGGREIAAVGDR
ncbi:MAG: VOC family protein [Cyanobacteria bacterium SBLK]|nr:VOC family protein [Cyanobacteria bacterium SBLK]